MELILRDDIEKPGRRGEVVDVAAGYARNYLLPRGLAMAVSDTNKAQVDREKRAWEARMAKEKEEFESLAERIAELRFVAPRKVGENELLYGSVTSADVGDFLQSKGIDIDKRRVLLDEPIKHLGEHEIKVRLHPEVNATVKLLVTKEG